MKIIDDGDPCECGSTRYRITATLIDCLGCGRLWGRVNGQWVQDDGMEQVRRDLAAPGGGEGP